MRGLGDLESEVMDRLWRWERPATVRDVVDDLNTVRPLAYTTVQTVMENLFRKGWLLRASQGRAHRYEPTITREAAAARRTSVSPSLPRAARSWCPSIGRQTAAPTSPADLPSPQDPARSRLVDADRRGTWVYYRARPGILRQLAGLLEIA